MLKKIERYFVELIQGKKHGIVATLAKGLLVVLSWFYQFGVYLRNKAFDQGFLKLYYAPGPVVISVGNIVVGGTGKTPITLFLAETFYNDFCIAILSRGYRSKAEHLANPTVLCKGKGPKYPATYCGDEAFLLAQNLPKALVYVGKNRHDASNLAAKDGAQLILLDDGMQHRHLARDYEIVVLDAFDPFGKGHFLPRGFLREGVASLARADLIILNHYYDDTIYLEVKEEITKHSKAPLVGMLMEPKQILTLAGDILSSIENKKVAIFCAIAHPDYFYKTVKDLKGDIVLAEFLPDHLALSTEELQTFCQRAIELGAEWILCTEKDYVKLDKKALNDEKIAWLKMGMKIVKDEEAWDRFINTVKIDLKHRT